jgi:hypothetical protein
MGNVLFYLDEDGQKHDRDLHAEMLRNPKAKDLADKVAAEELRRIRQRAKDSKKPDARPDFARV